MTTIGFDVSKTELVGVRIDRSGKHKEAFSLPNDVTKISDWLTSIRTIRPHLTIAVEATAEHHLSLAKACVAQQVPLRVLNPIVTKQYTRSTVRKRKTDPGDALAIARLAAQGEGAWFIASDLHPAKALSRTSDRLGRLLQMLHLMQKRATETFGDECPEFAVVLGEPMTALTDAQKRLRQMAVSSTDTEQLELLCSLPGIGPRTATVLLTEIGDVARFPSANALIAFTGLDPKVRQSGRTLQRNTRLTKRGSPYLRRSLFIAATIAQRHDSELREYYEKKRSEGKPYRVATVAVARKLIHRVYAVWKRGEPYVACGKKT